MDLANTHDDEFARLVQRVERFELEVVQVESNPQLVQIVPPNEVVVLISFELTVGEVRGIGAMAGMEIVRVPGATGYFDTDYAGKGEAAVKALGTGLVGRMAWTDIRIRWPRTRRAGAPSVSLAGETAAVAAAVQRAVNPRAS